jgi:hypothetical protein
MGGGWAWERWRKQALLLPLVCALACAVCKCACCVSVKIIFKSAVGKFLNLLGRLVSSYIETVCFVVNVDVSTVVLRLPVTLF